MSFQHPGIGRIAVPGAVAPRDTKIDGWASMRHLFQLQMRSKAPQLKARLIISLVLVLAGKGLGVWAPLAMGHAINLLAAGKGGAEQVAIAFTGFILLWFRVGRDIKGLRARASAKA